MERSIQLLQRCQLECLYRQQLWRTGLVKLHTWGGITKHEVDFNQDLRSDGGIGLATLTPVAALTPQGARLKRDAENGLYIDVDNDGTNIIAIEDNYGGTPTFDHAGSWSDEWSSIWSSETVAVEQQSDGSYKLAVKNTNTWTNKSRSN